MNHSDAMTSARKQRSGSKWKPYTTAALLAAGALITCALLNRRTARKAERDNPPSGKFVRANGVRLHYVERGHGEPLVLLHGNGSMIQDFETSGLIEAAARTYRVIVFDRPGYGHSERPRSTVWTAEAQSNLFHAALGKLGVTRAIVLGHSWGASVAVALALRHPEAVAGLVLASGYYYPTVRSDVALLSGPAVPVIGDILRYTISPVLGRMIWPLLLRKVFGPSPMPAKFNGFPVEIMPVAIIAGEADRIVDTDQQSARLHGEVPQSTFDHVPGTGHMIHQTATARVMSAIDAASGRAPRSSETPSVVPTAA